MKTTPYVKFACAIVNVRPKKSSSLGSPGKVRSFETMCVKANAMLSVPSVTMKAGSRTSVTRAPFRAPKATQVRIPREIARSGDMPLLTANFVITTCPSAITVPTERSIPAVRITSVCPIASTPTTITCCITSDRFWASRKRSDLTEKKAIASTRAMSGPTVGVVSTLTANCPALARLLWCPAEGVSVVVNVGSEAERRS